MTKGFLNRNNYMTKGFLNHNSYMTKGFLNRNNDMTKGFLNRNKYMTKGKYTFTDTATLRSMHGAHDAHFATRMVTCMSMRCQHAPFRMDTRFWCCVDSPCELVSALTVHVHASVLKHCLGVKRKQKTFMLFIHLGDAFIQSNLDAQFLSYVCSLGIKLLKTTTLETQMCTYVYYTRYTYALSHTTTNILSWSITL